MPCSSLTQTPVHARSRVLPRTPRYHLEQQPAYDHTRLYQHRINAEHPAISASQHPVGGHPSATPP
eukprot:1819020-Amphidinium_carterae.1